jgi:hypothetical protein
LVSLTISAKFNEDFFFTNTFYAKVGGITASELNILEQNFFKMIDYDLRVNPDELEIYLKEILKFQEGKGELSTCNGVEVGKIDEERGRQVAKCQ